MERPGITGVGPAPGKPTCLALACSPRINGNTSQLAAAALEECRLAGCATEFIQLADYRFEPCRACGACNTTGKCVIKDDALQLFDKIRSVDRLIVAAPIFSMGINAQAKALIDRSQQFWAVKYLLDQKVVNLGERPARNGIFISCAGTNLPGVFDGAIRVIKYFFMIMEVKLVKTLCYSDVDLKGEILEHPGALEEVKEYGRKLAEI
ncbi:Multimeric flavodoxin WrbA [Desulfotomaculum arcticum]|uniref:Multimeric flavodoxin WrbA n=1 Tax=Desulfotruncus arcticus DSM 17038 TaxID=1121424 RepID=A0A1I2SVJ8_9FIRM|nr:flavodoxin family protein [Desulfotruncus arcticus]SFG53941.1 Multimeric flavodoxin WrbA [Desulfotomaculum arcticum] [Desulfotruncus arcticus DSM 17038]